MSRPCPRILVLDRLDADLGSQVTFTALVELLGRAAEDTGVDLAIDQSGLDALPLRASTIETVNASYDLLVITGEDALSHQPSSASGWSLDIPAADLDAIEIPIAVLAAGYDAPAFLPDPLLAEGVAHLTATASRAAVFSTRDPGAAALIGAAIGRPVPSLGPLEVVLSPAAGGTPAFIDPARRPIGLSLQLDQVQDVLPFPFQMRFETMMRALVDALEYLAREDNRQIVFAPHTQLDVDAELARLLEVRIPADSLVQLPHVVPGLYAPTDIHRAETLMQVYASLDTVIGHRPASVTVPFAAGTPTVLLAATPGARMLHEAVGGPPARLVDLSRFDEEVNVPRFLEALRAPAEAGFAERAAARRDEMRGALAETAVDLVRAAQARFEGRPRSLDQAASF